MYNIANHYENLYQYLRTIIADPRVAYLHPFGSTQPENLELFINKDDNRERKDPIFIFYDQEPLDLDYNRRVFDSILERTAAPYVLVTTEQTSEAGDAICAKYPFARVDYFFHVFAASDWFRGHEYLPGLKPVFARELKRSYITFNRLTSSKRVYRSLLVSELAKNRILDQGYVSYSKTCPEGGDYIANLRASGLDRSTVEEAIANISSLPELRIDFADQMIPNQSMLLTPMKELMESFVFLVTETCFFESKTHLTEKIFKPIALKMPFLLLGCAHNLEYLRRHGFITFGDYWDESYDEIEDPVERLRAVVKILQDICSMSPQEQQDMLVSMWPILEHNYQRFTDGSLVREEWTSLTNSLKEISKLYQFVPPYRPNTRLGQAIPC